MSSSVIFKQPSLQFQGRLTTSQAQRRILCPQEMDAFLAQDSSPYLGECPVPLLGQLNSSEENVCRQLDALADFLKGMNNFKLRLGQLKRIFSRQNKPQSLVEGLLDQGLKVRHVRTGQAGSVYRLKLGQQRYAFKVMRERCDKDSNMLEEAANGIYLTGQPTQDVAAMYLANVRQGWQLNEYIDKKARVELRPGKTLEAQGLILSDDSRWNRIKGIRVDLGGVLGVLGGEGQK